MAGAREKLFRDKLCSLTPNGRPARRSQQHLLYLKKPKAITGLQQCMQSRPPISWERLNSPSPCTYSVSSSPCKPSCKFDPYICERPQFSKCNLWVLETKTQQVWPTACSYNLPQLIGQRSQWSRNSPSYSIGYKLKKTGLSKKGGGPSPASYNVLESLKGVVYTRAPCYSIPQSVQSYRPIVAVSTPPIHYTPTTTPAVYTFH